MRMNSPSPGKDVSFKAVSELVAVQLEGIYSKSSIPTVSRARIIQLLQTLHGKYYSFRKSYRRDQDNEGRKKIYEDFIAESQNQLFDICACKCKMSNECTCNRSLDKCSCPDPIHIACKCSDLVKRIPKIEKKFVYDQRTRRVGKIGPLDRKETEKLTKRAVRRERQSNLGQKSSESLLESIHIDVEQVTSETEERDVNISSTDLDFVPPQSTSSQMRVSLKATALASDRYGVSDRATAAIASSVLKDMGIVIQSDKSLVIDRHKIRREREKCQEHLKNVQLNASAIKGPKATYFDGRADNTLTLITKGSKRYQSHITEEHISIIEEPGSKYLNHVVPSSKSGKDSAMSVVSNLRENGVDLSDIEVVGADGTVTNTGWNNGAIRCIELSLNKPLQHVICLFHFNELPLRHLIENLMAKPRVLSLIPAQL